MASINYTVTDNWGSGFVGNMTVAGGNRALQGWTVEFDAAFGISSIWGAVILSHVGNHYVIGNLPWNSGVAAGTNTTFGFQATPGADGPVATSLTVSRTDPDTSPPVVSTLSIADASIDEGNGGSSQLPFTASLSQAATGPDTATPPSAGTVSVAYSVTSNWGAGFTGDMKVGGSAPLDGWTVEFNASFNITNIWNAEIVSHVGNHYVVKNAAYNGQVPAGQQVAFGFQADAGSGGTQATGFTVNGTAVGPNPGPTLSVADATVSEGDSGTHDLAFTVSLSAAAKSPVTVKYGTTNGTATAGSDYTARSGTLTFAAGETSKVVHVSVLGDKTVEPNETLALTLSSPKGATIARGTATGTIRNDDVAPSLGISNATFAEGSAGTPGKGTFTVTLSKASASPVTVKFATSNGTASAGSDYVAKSGTLSFAAGETTKTISVAAIGDAVAEPNEGFSVALSNPTGATIARGTARGTITNDDGKPPSLRISDATFAEGSAAMPGHGTFAVTLSKASTAPVTVHYATSNGTATAGSDYAAKSGTLTFAAGQTTKTVSISAVGDSAVEANEDFTVVLSNAGGATIADGTGVGTIDNDDVLPTLGIGDTSVVEGNPGAGGGAGWFSTSGNQIIDSTGHSVQIAGVNWFGFEGTNLSPNGLWTRGYKDMMNQMVSLGFNTIRLPFSSDMLHSTAAPGGIDVSRNPDLQGLSALQVMDKIVDYAGRIGLKIILDHHRSDPGDGVSPNGLWYDAQHSQAQWLSDWAMLATRYADKPQVIGADLHNEPYNGTWGGGGPNDWAAAAEQAGNVIGRVNPNWLVFVEGVGTYQGQSYWWGGNLMGVKDRPIRLDVTNKLVYSAHDYPNSVYPQPWFQGSGFPANLPAKFDQMWGYIYKQNIAPVYIGEFGTKLTDPKDAPWLEAITSYLGGDLDNDGTHDIAAGKKGVSWTFWSWNPNSGDTGGILKDDWTSVNQDKLDYLKPIEFDFGSTSGGGAHADFVLTLSAPAPGPVTVQFHTVAGDATSADFTGSSGSVTFAAGERSKTISIPITGDLVDEANERFTVVLTNATGATISRATGTATIIDDDGGSAAAPASGSLAKEFSPNVNDIASGTFTLVDAQAPVNFAQNDANVVRLSMWSVARDNGATAGAHYASPDSSGVAQTTYEFAGVLNRFDTTG